jgi:hypothetical protein
MVLEHFSGGYSVSENPDACAEIDANELLI